MKVALFSFFGVRACVDNLFVAVFTLHMQGAGGVVDIEPAFLAEDGQACALSATANMSDPPTVPRAPFSNSTVQATTMSTSRS